MLGLTEKRVQTAEMQKSATTIDVAVGCIHGQNIEGCFSLGSLIQLGHDQVLAISALQITVPVFNCIAGTGILDICLTPWRQYPPSWAAPEPNQSGGYHVLRNTCGYTVLVDLIGKDSFRIASKLTAVLFTTVWRLHPSLKLLQLVCSRYVYPKA